MPKSDITIKARQLLSRRTAPNSAWSYVRQDWRRQAVFLVAYIAIPIVLWRLDMKGFAIAAAGFFVGTKVRDVRWWVASSREWPTTSELLNWPKIETIAGKSEPVSSSADVQPGA